MLELIKDSISKDYFRVTKHSLIEAGNNGLNVSEVINSVFTGELIEYYPFDKPFPSCLILSMIGEIPVHSVWAFNEVSEISILITIYIPSKEKWDDFRKRK